jgi:hypothetical protein
LRLPDGAEALFTDSSRPFKQRTVAMDVWCVVVRFEPNIAKPTCGYAEDGAMYFGWNPGPASLDIEIHADGDVSWFYADHGPGGTVATSDRGPGDGYLQFVKLFAGKP